MNSTLLLFCHVIISALVALLGRNRKIGYAWSFVFCLVLSAFVGVIIILFSKKNNEVDIVEKPKDIQQNQKPRLVLIGNLQLYQKIRIRMAKFGALNGFDDLKTIRLRKWGDVGLLRFTELEIRF